MSRGLLTRVVRRRDEFSLVGLGLGLGWGFLMDACEDDISDGYGCDHATLIDDAG